MPFYVPGNGETFQPKQDLKRLARQEKQIVKHLPFWQRAVQ
jgi:hypothetical protein